MHLHNASHSALEYGDPSSTREIRDDICRNERHKIMSLPPLASKLTQNCAGVCAATVAPYLLAPNHLSEKNQKLPRKKRGPPLVDPLERACCCRGAPVVVTGLRSKASERNSSAAADVPWMGRKQATTVGWVALGALPQRGHAVASALQRTISGAAADTGGALHVTYTNQVL